MEVTVEQRAPVVRCYKCGSSYVAALCHHCWRPGCAKHVLPSPQWAEKLSGSEGGGPGLQNVRACHCSDCAHVRAGPAGTTNRWLAVGMAGTIPPRGNGSGSSFAEEMRKAGLTPSTKLVQAEAGRPPAAVAEQLGLGDDEQVLIRARHMFTDGRPAQLATSCIPLSVAGGTGLAFPDTGPAGIHARLAERGHRVERFAEEVESRRPDAEEAQFLRISRTQHVLEVTRLAFDRAGRVLEVTVNVFPSNLWRLSYEWAAND